MRLDDEAASQQGARCMDCGIPFCQTGCPVNNIIPDWNDLVYRGDWQRRDRQRCTRPTTSRSSPAGSARRRARPPARSTSTAIRSASSRSSTPSSTRPGKKAGWSRWCRRRGPASGSPWSARAPPGLACAQQLARAGHEVTVFEKNDRIGGLLRYGIPDFKMEKHLIDRRVQQMQAEGVVFRTRRAGDGQAAGHHRQPEPRDHPRRKTWRRNSTRSCSPVAPRCRATCRFRGAS